MPKVIRVRPVPGAMVPDFKAQDDRVMRFIGFKYDATKSHSGGFVASAEPVELDISGFEKEYLDEIRAGALELADEASAKLCGVAWKAPAVVKAQPAVTAAS